MATQLAKGAFTIALSPLSTHHDHGGAPVGRISIDKTYTGDLVGTGAGEMLTALTAVQGSAAYVAIERVSGTLQGRRARSCFSTTAR